MSRTSPVQIVNKNGVKTTVHKRIDSASSSSKTAGIPMPALKAAEPQDNCKLIAESSFEVALNGSKMSDNVRAKLIATLHPETLTRVADILRSGVPMRTIRRSMSACVGNRNFAVLNSMAVLVPELEDTSINNQDRLMYALTGLQHDRDDRTPEIDITNESDPRSRAVRIYLDALLLNSDDSMRTTRTTAKKQQMFITFNERQVGKMILEQPERAGEIVSLYRTRGTFDRELYEEALSNGVSSMVEGNL